MSASRIVEPVDILEDHHLSPPAGVPVVPPNQICLGSFEERLSRLIIIAIPFSAHRRFEPVLAEDLLIVMRTILAATVSVMDATRW